MADLIKSDLEKAGSDKAGLDKAGSHKTDHTTDMDKVWKAYEKTKDPALKEKLILQYAPLVKYVAGRLSIHIGQHVEFDDLLSYGIFGLIDAVDKFDFTKRVKFETYASLRIRGSIIDSIRKLDWVPRTLRQKNKQLEEVYSSLESALGREPSEEELAAKLGVTVEESRDIIKKNSLFSLVSLDDYLEQNHELALSGTSQSENPADTYDRLEARQILTDAIDKLTDKERTVINLYYFEEMTLKEISAVLEVSESRVSQIHAKAVLKLNKKLGKYKSLLFSL